ncbi:MAG TPA: ATP-dependent DNA helicase [Bacillales bacterium]|nr:ATP-dependent DNA helicase [Bacillales bacterium]
MPNEVRLSVRGLVEHVYRSGSIDSRFRTSSTLTEGTKAHQKIQKTYGDSGEKEVYLETRIPYEDLEFVIDGRCDGLLFKKDEVMIDEIKSTRGELRDIEEDTHPVHWAQAKFYAYMYAKAHDVDRMHVQLTYVQVKTEEQKQFRETVSFDELESYIKYVIERYAPFAVLMQQHKEKRNESIRELPFPFGKYRDGQRKLAGAVYQTISEEKSLFASAPTGIGKTISTTFPAVKAMGEGLLDRMFYLTAKTTTRETAEESFSLMEEKGLCLNAVTVTAKHKICFQEETICQPDYCEFADGYYDRVNDAIFDILSNETFLTRAVIEEYARKHTVCPFEFSLDLVYAADAVICDYNYIFDPRVSLKRLFDEQKKQTALLIDEAHNLVDRARNMFSADLMKSNFLQVKRAFKDKDPDIFEAAKAINEHFLFLKKQCGEPKMLVMDELEEELITLLDAFIFAAEQVLVRENDPLLLDTYFAAQNFVRIAKLFDERYVTYVEVERSEVHVKMFCLDPSYLLQQIGKRYRSKIYFSATLAPLGYYQDMLGREEEDFSIRIPSPFAAERSEVFIQPLSTRYRDRDRTKASLVSTIHQVVSDQPGNYLVFFPSYQYMMMAYDAFEAADPSVRTIVQDRRMSEADRDAFLASFQADNSETLVGFAVLGGVFSEGVDLKGDRLNGVIVVGVGLPQIGLERNIIRDYFNSTGKNGYDYAYVFPGMTKVLQAGGRLIRSEDDHGVIVLVDDRFLHRNYQALLPEEWQDFSVWKEAHTPQ